ncbi:MAG TPA: alpha/beta hydrolase-fold protein [Chloroflexia bacterium]|nr:alpha/beta hydrolase-fold protein [Chloroflexia bacterium]
MTTIGTVEMTSQALGQVTTYTIFLPERAFSGPGPYPVLMQLHGRFGGHRNWLYNSNLLNYLGNTPLVVVLPDGADHMWSNMYPTIPYEEFLVKELRENVEDNFPVRKGSPWAIGGLSMGGYGALRLGLKYSDKFCSVYAHSSPVHTREDMASWPNNFTPKIMDDLDLYYLAEHTDPARLPRYSFDCGTEDTAAIGDNRKFHAHLEKLALPHEYHEYPGQHNWQYWNKHVQTALRQHTAVFGIELKQ